MNNFKKCTCTCTEGGSNNPFCVVHSKECICYRTEGESSHPYCKIHGIDLDSCGACGKDLDNRACNNKYCDLYDPIAVLVN